MAVFNMHDAKTNLSDLVARAEAGEEIVIARRNVPVVKLLPLPTPDTRPSDPSAQPGFDPFEHAPDDYISKQDIAAYYRKYPQEWREMTLMVGFGETGQAEYEAAVIGGEAEAATHKAPIPAKAKNVRGFGMLAHLPPVPDDFFFKPLSEADLMAWEDGEEPESGER